MFTCDVYYVAPCLKQFQNPRFKHTMTMYRALYVVLGVPTLESIPNASMRGQGALPTHAGVALRLERTPMGNHLLKTHGRHMCKASTIAS